MTLKSQVLNIANEKTNVLFNVQKYERKTNAQHSDKQQPLNYRLLNWDKHIHTECG